MENSENVYYTYYYLFFFYCLKCFRMQIYWYGLGKCLYIKWANSRITVYCETTPYDLRVWVEPLGLNSATLCCVWSNKCDYITNTVKPINPPFEQHLAQRLDAMRGNDTKYIYVLSRPRLTRLQSRVIAKTYRRARVLLKMSEFKNYYVPIWETLFLMFCNDTSH